MGARRNTTVGLLIASMTMAFVASTEAAPAVTVTRISGASPLTDQACSRTTAKHAETDGTLSINPTDADNIVTVWTQDDSMATVVGVSFDGGGSWESVIVPGLSRCSGGDYYESSFDPWVSFGPDGTLYLTAVMWRSETDTDPHPGFKYAVAATRSTDGGLTWATPTLLSQQSTALLLDKATVTADPTRPETAYAVWTEIVALASSLSWFSTTTDGGLTWSAPRIIAPPPTPGYAQFGSEIVVASDGTLVHGFIEFPLPQVLLGPVSPTMVKAQHSIDGGDTWSALPVTVGSISELPVSDPEASSRTFGVPWVVPRWAAGPDRVVAAVWHDISADGTSSIVVARSTTLDTWSTTIVHSSPVQAFKTALAFGSDQTVAVSFYDFRNDSPGDATLGTDVWMKLSSDGVTWDEVHLGGPFDLRAMPTHGSTILPGGDYFGVVSTPGGFATMFQMGQPSAIEGPSDVFLARVLTAEE